MKAISRVAHGVAHAMHKVSAALLVFMVLSVLVDVTARFVFGVTEGGVDFTFRGGVEIVSYSLLFMVLFALPYSVSRGQVVVDIFTERMAERSKRLLAGIYNIGFALLGLGITIRFYEAIGATFRSGETSQDLLIPLYYIYAFATFGAAVLALRSLVVAVEQIADRGKRP